MPSVPQESILFRHHGFDFDTSPDTDLLAQTLVLSTNLDKPINDFVRGKTSVRDVSSYTTAERETVLSIGQQEPVSITSEQHALFVKAATSLRNAMTHNINQAQPYAGFNFLVVADRLIGHNLPGAQHLSDCFRAEFGHDIPELVRILDSQGIEFKPEAHNLVASIASNPNYAQPVAYYLARKSEAAELSQESQHGSSLAAAKNRALSRLEQFAGLTGLSAACQDRAAEQIGLTRFSAFDHLSGGVTEGDRGSNGDYVPGTFRIEVKLTGRPGRPGPPKSPRETIQHELTHASAAQDGKYRCGLRINYSAGLDADEGMTEFLTQSALNFPAVRLETDGSRIIAASSYPNQLASMLSLAQGQEEHFATLYRAYYGQVNSQHALSVAFDAFYGTLASLRG
jgi:hypothetical protein